FRQAPVLAGRSGYRRLCVICEHECEPFHQSRREPHDGFLHCPLPAERRGWGLEESLHGRARGALSGSMGTEDGGYCTARKRRRGPTLPSQLSQRGFLGVLASTRKHNVRWRSPTTT